MIHYSCDRCKRMINPKQQIRYEVKLAVQPAIDPVECDEPDDERDHLMELDDLLELTDFDDYVDESARQSRYDLCPRCYQKFIKDPLGADLPVPLSFSQN